MADQDFRTQAIAFRQARLAQRQPGQEEARAFRAQRFAADPTGFQIYATPRGLGTGTERVGTGADQQIAALALKTKEALTILNTVQSNKALQNLNQRIRDNKVVSQQTRAKKLEVHANKLRQLRADQTLADDFDIALLQQLMPVASQAINVPVVGYYKGAAGANIDGKANMFSKSLRKAVTRRAQAFTPFKKSYTIAAFNLIQKWNQFIRAYNQFAKMQQRTPEWRDRYDNQKVLQGAVKDAMRPLNDAIRLAKWDQTGQDLVRMNANKLVNFKRKVVNNAMYNNIVQKITDRGTRLERLLGGGGGGGGGGGQQPAVLQQLQVQPPPLEPGEIPPDDEMGEGATQ